MADKSYKADSPHPDWSSEDATNLRKFLRTISGSKFLGMLSQLRPRLHSSGVEAVALEAKLGEGWEQCVDIILRAGLLKSSREVIEPVAYPDLDSEEGWEPTLQVKKEPEPEILTSADIEKRNASPEVETN